jgi:hypothetical protein
MKAKKGNVPCVVCNPEYARSDEYCEAHQEELHRLTHEYETFYRLVRAFRGKDHEVYAIVLQGECDPAGRILVNETDPDNLVLTVLVTGSLDLDALLPDYEALKIKKSCGDLLREKIENEIIRSWYGNARACIDLFRIRDTQPLHWDIAPRDEQAEEEFPGEGGPCDKGGSHSIH